MHPKTNVFDTAILYEVLGNSPLAHRFIADSLLHARVRPSCSLGFVDEHRVGAMMDFTPGLTPLIDLADKLGFLQAFRGKLTRQPHRAAQELGAVLDEIAKVYEAILSELSKYLSITFYQEQPSDQRERQLQALRELETSALIEIRIGDARGSCEKITNIYNTFLSPWFSKELSPVETDMLSSLFRDLDEFDGIMIDTIKDFARWLSQQASETLKFINEPPPLEVDPLKVEEVRQRILRAHKEVAAPRKEMLEAIRTLYDLQAEFIAVSGAV
jgi:hypothetical protein